MNAFFEFFIERLLWLWLPLYAMYRVLKDVVADFETPEEIQP